MIYYGATFQTKPGVCLPKTDDQWTMANDFFKSFFINIDFDSDIIDANAVVKLINDSIYNYLKENYGTVKTHVSKELVLKYNEYSVHSLKKALKRLKIIAAPLKEIRYIARLLRSKLRSKSDSSNNTSPMPEVDYDNFISRNFWGFVKRIVERPHRTLPSFSREVCTTYFHTLFAPVLSSKHFCIPNWFP